MKKLFKIKFFTIYVKHIVQKIDIFVVAMEKFCLATIFIRHVNDFILISDFKYELNWTSLSYKKITIRFCCFCSTATVFFSKYISSDICKQLYESISWSQTRKQHGIDGEKQTKSIKMW